MEIVRIAILHVSVGFIAHPIPAFAGYCLRQQFVLAQVLLQPVVGNLESLGRNIFPFSSKIEVAVRYAYYARAKI